MKKFSYKLEPVLRVRRLAEEEQKRLLGEAAAAFNQAMDDIRRLQQQIADEDASFKSNDLMGVLDMRGIARNRAYVNHLRRMIAEKISRAQELQQRLQERQQAYIRARRDVDVIEKLRDKARTQHAREFEREQTRELDDVTGSRWCHDMAVSSERHDELELADA